MTRFMQASVRFLLCSAVAHALLALGCASGVSVGAVDPCLPWVAKHADGASVGSARLLVERLMEAQAMPGASVAVATRSGLLWSEGLGVRDISSNQRVCRDTEFRIGSVSKVLTAVTLLRLMDAGRIDLDTDVRTLVQAASWQPHPITLRQLAGHLGGIRHYGGADYFNTRHYDSVEEALEVFARDPLRSVPGTTFLYSSYGYNLLGAAMESAADTPCAALVRTMVLDPLHLEATSPESAAPAGRLATPYSQRDDSLVTHPEFDTSDRLPSGGWVASAGDLATLGMALLDADFLTPASRSLLTETQHTAAGEATGYSFGLRVADDGGIPILEHGGTSVGARAFLLIYPSRGLAIALLANGPATYAESEVAEIARLFLPTDAR